MRLVVTSATLDGEKFSAFFDDCPVMTVPGRCFPVTVVHSAEEHAHDYLQAAVYTALDVHTQEAEGASPAPPSSPHTHPALPVSLPDDIATLIPEAARIAVDNSVDGHSSFESSGVQQSSGQEADRRW